MATTISYDLWQGEGTPEFDAYDNGDDYNQNDAPISRMQLSLSRLDFIQYLIRNRRDLSEPAF